MSRSFVSFIINLLFGLHRENGVVGRAVFSCVAEWPAMEALIGGTQVLRGPRPKSEKWPTMPRVQESDETRSSGRSSFPTSRPRLSHRDRTSESGQFGSCSPRIRRLPRSRIHDASVCSVEKANQAASERPFEGTDGSERVFYRAKSETRCQLGEDMCRGRK